MTENSQSRRLTRRRVVQTIGSTAAATGLLGLSTGAMAGERSFAIEQAGDCTPVEPLNYGFMPVEDFYNYAEGDDAGESQGSEGAQSPQEEGGDRPGDQQAAQAEDQDQTGDRNSTRDGDQDRAQGEQPYRANLPYPFVSRLDPNVSYLFLYRDEEGLSLVILHDVSPAEGGGGAASIRLTDLPAGVEWVVRDDPPGGEDVWNVEDGEATIHWTWGRWATDGAVLRGLDESFQLRIDPSFNVDAELYPKHPGELTDWQFLSGNPDDPDVVDLSMDDPVALGTGGCS